MKQLLFLVILVCSAGCVQKADKQRSKTGQDVYDPAMSCMIADTIIYDVIIRNTNPYDTWMEKSLGKLQHEKFIDSLFGLIYERKVKAFDYFTGDPMSVKKIKEMESELNFSRDQIGKVQFTETWYFDKNSKTLHKSVLSIALGHELYDDLGELRGYKPVFKVHLNPD